MDITDLRIDSPVYIDTPDEPKYHLKTGIIALWASKGAKYDLEVLHDDQRLGYINYHFHEVKPLLKPTAIT